MSQKWLVSLCYISLAALVLGLVIAGKINTPDQGDTGKLATIAPTPNHDLEANLRIVWGKSAYCHLARKASQQTLCQIELGKFVCFHEGTFDEALAAGKSLCPRCLEHIHQSADNTLTR